MRKKPLAITAIVLAVLIAVAAVVSIFFTSIMFYFTSKDKYPALNKGVTPATGLDAKDTSGMEKVNMKGYSIYIPAGSTEKNDLSDTKMIMYSDKKTCIILEEPKEIDLAQIKAKFTKDITYDEFVAGYKSIYGKEPKTMFDYASMVNSVTWDDFKMFDKTSKKLFPYISDNKIKLFTDIKSFQNDNVKGFIMSKPDSDGNYLCDLYDLNGNMNIIVDITADKETLAKMLNSIEINK